VEEQRFFFPRKARLRTRTEFTELFDKGASFSFSPIKTVYLFEQAQTPGCKFGVVAPKKKFKKAVDRNRIKRLLRESCRIHKSMLEKQVHTSGISAKILFIYQNNQLPCHKLIEDKLVLSFTKLVSICKEQACEKSAQ